ncbi:MAG TPA: EpsI family protein [Candidatus Udaeobacter sp.]|jgi:EpsI family protein|nr:EpsI family protein [Candidatus Udaeobacter sp.]
MTSKRLAALQIVLLGGLGSVFLVPRDVAFEPAAMNRSLPQDVGNWDGTDQAITQFERDVLGPNTQFARKVYRNPRGDEIFVSIVFSGPDMNTSIHRPERCLPAQGWTVADTRRVVLSTPAGRLDVTRLHNLRNERSDSDSSITIYGLNYYWFVGHEDETASHLERTWIDIRDRLLKGRNQEWAYVTVAGLVTKDFRVFGRTEKETDDLIQAFIAELAPKLQRTP